MAKKELSADDVALLKIEKRYESEAQQDESLMDFIKRVQFEQDAGLRDSKGNWVSKKMEMPKPAKKGKTKPDAPADDEAPADAPVEESPKEKLEKMTGPELKKMAIDLGFDEKEVNKLKKPDLVETLLSEPEASVDGDAPAEESAE